MKAKKLFVVALSAMCTLSLVAGFMGCSTTESGNESTEIVNVLASPTNFTFDPETGEYSFTDNDANAGYYFIRCYKVINGVEEGTYTVSSSRINGGTPGTKTGTIDISGFGWGEYSVKLVTFKASGTSYTAPSSVDITVQYGVGGTLEKPEAMVMYSGDTAEIVIDWYTLNDWYLYQSMPEVELNIYSDEACTSLVKSETIDTTELLDTIDVHPAGALIWGYSNAATFLPLSADGAPQGYLYDAYDYTASDLGGYGTYYATVQAKAPADYIGASQVSDVISFTLTDGEVSSTEFESDTTDLWMDPGVLGVPCAMYSTDTSSRVDYAGTQTVTCRVKS